MIPRCGGRVFAGFRKLNSSFSELNVDVIAIMNSMNILKHDT